MSPCRQALIVSPWVLSHGFIGVVALAISQFPHRNQNYGCPGDYYLNTCKYENRINIHVLQCGKKVVSATTLAGPFSLLTWFNLPPFSMLNLKERTMINSGHGAGSENILYTPDWESASSTCFN